MEIFKFEKKEKNEKKEKKKKFKIPRDMIYVMFALSIIYMSLLYFVIEYYVIIVIIAYLLLFYSIMKRFETINKRKIQGKKYLNMILVENGNISEEIVPFIMPKKLDYGNQDYFIYHIGIPYETHLILILKQSFKDEFKFSKEPLYFEDFDLEIDAPISQRKLFSILGRIKYFETLIIANIPFSELEKITDNEKTLSEEILKKENILPEILLKQEKLSSGYEREYEDSDKRLDKLLKLSKNKIGSMEERNLLEELSRKQIILSEYRTELEDLETQRKNYFKTKKDKVEA